MPVAVGLRLWLSGIVIYNLVCGVLAIIDPKVLDALFPGSAALWGLESRGSIQLNVNIFSEAFGSVGLICNLQCEKHTIWPFFNSKPGTVKCVLFFCQGKPPAVSSKIETSQKVMSE